MIARQFIELLRDTFKEWSDDKAARLGAALAYYTLFAIAPLSIIAVAIAGLAFGEATAQIFFFGAEFTQVYANRHGSRIRPAEDAVSVIEAYEEDRVEPPPVEPEPSPAPDKE